RGGSQYDTTAFDPLLSAAFGPTPTAGAVAMPSWIHTIGQFRSFDLADRKQNTLNGRIDYSLHPSVEGAVTFQVKDASYPEDYGPEWRSCQHLHVRPDLLYLQRRPRAQREHGGRGSGDARRDDARRHTGGLRRQLARRLLGGGRIEPPLPRKSRVARGIARSQ